MTADEFNERYSVGTPCKYYPTRGLPQHIITKTRSEAWELGHGAVVVKVEDRAGGVSIDHLAMVQGRAEPMPEICTDQLKGLVSDLEGEDAPSIAYAETILGRHRILILKALLAEREKTAKMAVKIRQRAQEHSEELEILICEKYAQAAAIEELRRLLAAVTQDYADWLEHLREPDPGKDNPLFEKEMKLIREARSALGGEQ